MSNLTGSKLSGSTLTVTIDHGRLPKEGGAGRRRTADTEGEEAPAPRAPRERAPREPRAPRVSTVWVAGLLRDTHTAPVLKAAFEAYGPVLEVDIARSGTFAFVKMASDAAVAAAVAGLNGHDLAGVTLTAEVASNEPKPEPAGGRAPRRSNRAA